MVRDPEPIEYDYEDFEVTDEAPPGNLTPEDQEGDCAGEGEDNDGS